MEAMYIVKNSIYNYVQEAIEKMGKLVPKLSHLKQIIRYNAKYI